VTPQQFAQWLQTNGATETAADAAAGTKPPVVTTAKISS